MISIQKVSKYFANTPALNSVSFEINKGEIVGFLGPNGAGKTTLMRILTTYLPPSEGKVSVCGLDVTTHPLEVRKNIGYLPETAPLYPEMTVYYYLKFAAQLKNVPQRQLNSQIDKTLEECSLKDVRKQTIATLSKGYRQRLGIAQAIVHNPQVLILDEPTSGLDPQQIIQVRELIKKLEHEKTVLLSTHILSEIEQIAKRVIIIKKGTIVADQALNDLFRSPDTPSKRLNLEEVFLRLTS